MGIFSNEENSDILLDIEDYQFHFKTFEYEFNIQPTYKIIQYPLNDNKNINITFEIDFNSTVSLLFDNNILLNFFDINDFSEINYISSIQNNPSSYSSHRSLLDYYDDYYFDFMEPSLIKENPGVNDKLQADMNAKVEKMKDNLEKQMKEDKKKYDAAKAKGEQYVFEEQENKNEQKTNQNEEEKEQNDNK